MLRAKDKKVSGCLYLEENFPNLSGTRIKCGIFIGPQIRQLIKDKSFEIELIDHGKLAWHFFANVVQYFFGYRQSKNNEELMLMNSYSLCHIKRWV